MKTATRSTSGAYIAQLGDYVIKLGDGAVGERIGQQADWLIKHECDGLIPVTFKVGPHAYLMPRAEAWPLEVSAETVFHTVVNILSEYVWSQPAEVVTDARELVEAKIHHVANATSGWKHGLALHKLCDEISWHQLPRCLTHGDPTFVNSMWLADRFVMCDPLPAGVLPDIRALDLGKLLQSCLGFETIVEGWHYPDHPSPYWVKTLCADENEWRAAVMFGALHVLRLIPYVGTEFREEFMRVFFEMLRL